MRPTTLATLVAMVALAIAATLGSAAARPGDERVIEGTLVWPEALTPEPTAGGERLIVVHDDLGARHLAQVTPSTEILTPLQAGQRVVVRGREGFDPAHLIAARVTSPTDDAAVQAPGGAQVEGTVIQVSERTLVLETRNARQVVVDLSGMRLPVGELLQPGREVRVFGTLRDGDRLIAVGLELDYVSAALPGTPAR
ncbi:MAG: hypothetical protein ACREJV_13140 [Candidatus Rokuibacteriota bacterium]